MCYRDRVGGGMAIRRVKPESDVFARVSADFGPVNPIHPGNPGSKGSPIPARKPHHIVDAGILLGTLAAPDAMNDGVTQISANTRLVGCWDLTTRGASVSI